MHKSNDIKFGLDGARLSSKDIVEKIILVTGDTDLVPSMKFAREIFSLFLFAQLESVADKTEEL
ncbi:NYN domain-containing protein [Paenibacillus turpanensis]|uniref:NYN domain-containing protein n=1 Tax=Paenibacillus turpanensis TaxID=2689078 RepID=UPI001407A86B|nr:NYN domain-containing protein [Paenibacillus turpanensis]